jgi:hypothetical protein
MFAKHMEGIALTALPRETGAGSDTDSLTSRKGFEPSSRTDHKFESPILGDAENVRLGEFREYTVAPNGYLLGKREYRIRAFFLPTRGNTIFMLTSECATVLGYRDSGLLFEENCSLETLNATEAENKDLIQLEIISESLSAPQVSLVTARSIFRCFGHKAIINGQSGRDDYRPWPKTRSPTPTEDEDEDEDDLMGTAAS